MRSNSRIVLLSRWVPPRIDGIGEYAFHLVQELRRQGQDVILLTSTEQPQTQPCIYPVIKDWKPHQVLQALKNFKPDWCVFQYAPPLYGKFGICPQISAVLSVLRKKIPCRIAVTFHEFSIGAQNNFKAWILKNIFDHQTKKIIRECDAAIGTCERHLNLLAPLNPDIPIKIIPVGTNVLMQIASEIELDGLRQKYKVQGGKIGVFFGRLSGFRNFQMTLKILVEARRRSIPLFLMLLGCVRTSNPSLFETFMIEARRLNVESYLIETGDLNPQQLSHHLQIADVFLFPQIDGISTRNTTVMSAMAHGLPIIAYEPVPGNYEGYQLPYGTWVDRGDEHAFMEKTIECLLSGGKPSLALRQRQYFADQFSWEKIAVEYRDLLNNA